MVISFFNGTNFINSVNNENKFIIPAHGIMIKNYQEIKEGIETSRVYPSDEPNSMVFHRNTLLYSDEINSKYYKYYHNKKIILVTLKNISLVNPEETVYVMPKLS